MRAKSRDSQVSSGRIPSVGASEDRLNRDLVGFLFAQLPRPGDALVGRRSRTGRVVLDVARRLLVAFSSPVIPAFGTDMWAHLAIDVGDAGERPPRPAEVGRRGRCVAGQAA